MTDGALMVLGLLGCLAYLYVGALASRLNQFIDAQHPRTITSEMDKWCVRLLWPVWLVAIGTISVWYGFRWTYRKLEGTNETDG
jgi:hypothetical protein